MGYSPPRTQHNEHAENASRSIRGRFVVWLYTLYQNLLILSKSLQKPQSTNFLGDRSTKRHSAALQAKDAQDTTRSSIQLASPANSIDIVWKRCISRHVIVSRRPYLTTHRYAHTIILVCCSHCSRPGVI